MSCFDEDPDAWLDLPHLTELLLARVERHFPGEIFEIELLLTGGFLLVRGAVASESARSAVLRQLTSFPNVPRIHDDIEVTGVFEPATDDEWFLGYQPQSEPTPEWEPTPESGRMTDGTQLGQRQPPNAASGAVVRYPAISTEEILVAGNTVHVVVDLTESPQTTDAPAFRLANLEPGWRELAIDVNLMSPAFKNGSGGSGVVRVLEHGGSEPARLTAELRSDLPKGSIVRVMAVFFLETRICGTWEVELGTTVNLMPQSQTDLRCPPISMLPKAPCPELSIVIKDAGHGKLDWMWTPPRGFRSGAKSHCATIDIGDAAAFSRKLIATCPLIKSTAIERRMKSIGEGIWARAPEDFRTTYLALRSEYGQSFSIQLILGEQSIPWEMMVPSIKGAMSLYLTHPIARWPIENSGYIPPELPNGTICSFVPDYENNGTLPAARLEGQWLENNLNAQRFSATTNSFLDLLDCAAAPSKVAMIHFAGHGRACSDHDDSGLRMQDDWVVAGDLNTNNTTLGRRDGSLVILNACEMATVSEKLGWVEGWAPLLIRHEFGGVIAPLWRVQDEAAREVIVTALDHLFNNGDSIGAAFTAGRAAVSTKSTAAFAFLTYGDVMATVSR